MRKIGYDVGGNLIAGLSADVIAGLNRRKNLVAGKSVAVAMALLSCANVLAGPVTAVGGKAHPDLDPEDISPVASVALLQKRAISETVDRASGEKVELQNFNQGLNRTYVLRVIGKGSAAPNEFHLENYVSMGRKLSLSSDGLYLLVDDSALVAGKAVARVEIEGADMAKAKKFGAYGSVRDQSGKIVQGLFVRNKGDNPSPGYMEMAAEALRSVGLEVVVDMYKESRSVDSGCSGSACEAAVGKSAMKSVVSSGPLAAVTTDSAKSQGIASSLLGIGMADSSVKALVPGQWYKSNVNQDVYVSAMQVAHANPEFLQDPELKKRVLDLSADGAKTLVTSFAVDMTDKVLEYHVGVNYPEVHWGKINDGQPKLNPNGPDGFRNILPLQRSGQVAPIHQESAIAAFVGGFKREHSAFRASDRARSGTYSHYGFVENGVVYSRLIPGLATLFTKKDGVVQFRNWTREDDATIADVVFARQNGVEVVSAKPGEISKPGLTLKGWEGNWSGDANGNLFSLRSSVCLQENGGRKFLIYSYFARAIPSAMAYVLASYNCQFAMQLDMNSAEMTYGSVYKQIETPKGKIINSYPINAGSKSSDDKQDGVTSGARFITKPDTRDFFFIRNRNAADRF